MLNCHLLILIFECYSTAPFQPGHGEANEDGLKSELSKVVRSSGGQSVSWADITRY